jgi:hypothetical protein
MVAPILTGLTPENIQLIAQLDAIAPGSLGGSTPPGWLNPNYVTGADHGKSIVGVTITFTALALVAVCLRLYTRATQKERSLGLDDFAIIPAMVSPRLLVRITLTAFRVLLLPWKFSMSWMFTMAVLAGTAGTPPLTSSFSAGGFVVFPLNFRETNLSARQYQFIIAQLYLVTTGFVKYSIISFLRRLLNTSLNWDYFFYGLYFCYSVIFLVPFFYNLFLCHPTSSLWNLRVYAATGGHCRDLFLETLVFCIIMAVSDVVLLAIPLFVVAKMNIGTKWKAGMIAMFGLGGLSCVFAVWKASYLRSVRGSLDDSCKFLLIHID